MEQIKTLFFFVCRSYIRDEPTRPDLTRPDHDALLCFFFLFCLKRYELETFAQHEITLYKYGIKFSSAYSVRFRKKILFFVKAVFHKIFISFY